MYEKLTAIEDDLTECETEAGQIAAAMGAIPQDKQETSIVFKSLQRKAAELDERYKTQARKRDALKARIVSIEVEDESIYNLAIYATDAARGIDHATFEEKRRWLEYLAIGVEVKDGKATASSKLKIEPVTIDLGILRSAEETTG